MKNSKHQGDVGLGIAIAWFVESGFRVSIPLTDSQDYDLVIERDGALKSVQVKTTYYKTRSGVYGATLVTAGGNRSGTGKIKHYDPSRFDYLFIVTESNEKYFIPSKDVHCKSMITLCDKYAQYKVDFATTWVDVPSGKGGGL